MMEVWNIHPEVRDVVVLVEDLALGAVVLDNGLLPEFAHLLRGDVALSPCRVNELLEIVEGALPNHRVDDVVNLLDKHCQPIRLGGCLGKEVPEDDHLPKDGGGLREGERRMILQRPLRVGQDVVTAVATL